jgi:hypothetical protein
MLEKLRRMLKRPSKTPEELVEEETIRRQAQQERYKAEQQMAEQKQRMESNPTLGPWGGSS